MKAAPETSGKIKAFPTPTEMKEGDAKIVKKEVAKQKSQTCRKQKNTASLVESVCVETIQFVCAMIVSIKYETFCLFYLF